jgi:hypothetical protein
MYRVRLRDPLRIYLTSKEVSMEPYDPSIEPDLACTMEFTVGTEGLTESSAEYGASQARVDVSIFVSGGLSLIVRLPSYQLEWVP